MRLAKLTILVVLFTVAACAKKPAPAHPAPANAEPAAAPAPGGDTAATPDSAAPAAGADSHSRGPVPKGGSKSGDPCEGGQ